jgi:hypothetical protein
VEPDYLPDSEVFVFSPCLYPMKTLHPGRMYTPPHGGVQGGLPPLWGPPMAGGSRPLAGVQEKAPEGKIAL